MIEFHALKALLGVHQACFAMVCSKSHLLDVLNASFHLILVTIGTCRPMAFVMPRPHV